MPFADTTQPKFVKSRTVATEFNTFSDNGLVVLPKSNNVSVVLVVSVIGVTFTVVVFKLEPTPLICVGLPSADVIFNAEVGASLFTFASVAFSVFKFTTGDDEPVVPLPSANVFVTFAFVNVTFSVVENVKFWLSCSIAMFLPAMYVTFPPAFTLAVFVVCVANLSTA